MTEYPWTQDGSLADDELSKLRHEMAAAILDAAQWDCHCEEPYSRQHHSKADCANLTEIADKLRAIIKEHTP